VKLVSQVLDLKSIFHTEKEFDAKFCGRLFYTNVGLQLHVPPFRSKLYLFEWNIKQSVFFQHKSTFSSAGGFGDIATIKNFDIKIVTLSI